MPRNTPRTFVGATTFQVTGMTCGHCQRAVTEDSSCSGAVSRSWLQSTVARRVCWRASAVRLPVVRTANRSTTRLASSAGLRLASRAAASSRARGMPSRRDR